MEFYECDCCGTTVEVCTPNTAERRVQEMDGNLPTFDEAMDKIHRLQKEVKHCRDELCLHCGKYKNAHLGDCDECRFARGGEWEKDLG